MCSQPQSSQHPHNSGFQGLQRPGSGRGQLKGRHQVIKEHPQCKCVPLTHQERCSPVQAPCRCLCPSNTSSLRGFFRTSSSARSRMPTEEARLAGEAARGASGGGLEPSRRGSSSNKICGQGRCKFQARLPPWAVLHSTSAYLAQPRGCGMRRRRPQRHVEHDDAIHHNERGNHHDENKIPEIHTQEA